MFEPVRREVKVVALGVPEVEADILRFAEVGVHAYVPPQAGVDDLIRAVNGVVRGEPPCSPRIAAALLRRVAVLAAAHGPQSEMRQLTCRERQTVQLIEEGLSNKEIARRLCIEVPTVKNHVHSILKKLRAKRRGEAAALLRGTIVLNLDFASNLPR
jgi:two-component system nitrate/nitrite response regulator NarL